MDKKNLMVGIISYLPNNEKRQDRLNFARKQFEWLSKLFDTKDIVFVAQNYTQEELLGYNNIIFDEGIGPSKARNVILDIFYNSNYDFLLQLDDDVLVYKNYYEIENIFKEINEQPDKFTDIDMITGIFPRFQPFKQFNQYKDFIIRNYTFVPRLLNSPGNFIIQRNLKKYYNNPIYYRDIDLFKFEGREDMSYLTDFILNGYKCYQCNQLIIDNLGEIKSCLFDYDKEQHSKQVKKCLEHYLKLYNIERKSNGNVDWSGFNNKFNKTEKFKYIPRQHNILNVDDNWFNIKPRGKNKKVIGGLF